jgi:hypothetical protein
MPTPKIRAMLIVASACAVQSPKQVKVTTTPVFKIMPNDLFLRSYESIGILNDTDISSLLAILLGLVPQVIQADVQKQLLDLPTTPGSTIGDAVDIVEEQILNHNA